MRPIALLLIILLSSCAITKERMVGTYSYEPAFEIGAYIDLNADSTFYYNSNVGRRTEAAGYWKIDKKGLILNSFNNGLNIPVVAEKADHDYVVLHVKAWQDPLKGDEYQVPGASASIYRNGQMTEGITDMTGMAKINIRASEIDSIKVLGLSYYHLSFIPPPNTNCFDVRLSYGEVIAIHETWRIKGRKIYAPVAVKRKTTYTFLKMRIKRS